MINYLNTGLFFGLHKVQGKVGKGEETASQHTKTKEGIVPNLNCLLQGALPGKQHDLLKKSISVHGKKINDECKSLTHRGTPHTRNLFITEKLGGMGIKPPEGWKFYVSKNDLYVAHGQIKKFGYNYCTELPAPGPSPTDASYWKDEPWQPRNVPKDKETPRVSYHAISYKNLKKLCRSQVFEFYVPYKGCLTSVADKPKRKSIKASLSKKNEDDLSYFDKMLDQALKPVKDEFDDFSYIYDDYEVVEYCPDYDDHCLIRDAQHKLRMFDIDNESRRLPLFRPFHTSPKQFSKPYKGKKPLRKLPEKILPKGLYTLEEALARIPGAGL